MQCVPGWSEFAFTEATKQSYIVNTRCTNSQGRSTAVRDPCNCAFMLFLEVDDIHDYRCPCMSCLLNSKVGEQTEQSGPSRDMPTTIDIRKYRVISYRYKRCLKAQVTWLVQRSVAASYVMEVVQGTWRGRAQETRNRLQQLGKGAQHDLFRHYLPTRTGNDMPHVG